MLVTQVSYIARLTFLSSSVKNIAISLGVENVVIRSPKIEHEKMFPELNKITRPF